jgi:hypothetical protein
VFYHSSAEQYLAKPRYNSSFKALILKKPKSYNLKNDIMNTKDLAKIGLVVIIALALFAYVVQPIADKSMNKGA